MSSQFARLRGALDRVGTTTPGTIVGVFAEDLTAIMNHYVEVVKEAAELKAARAQPAQAVPATCGECGKKASDGWALYCVACMEEAGLPAQAAPLFVFAQEVIHGAYRPEELKDAAMRAIRHHSAVRAKLGVAVPMPPEDWSVFNTGAEVASGLTWAEAWDYMTPSRIDRGWSAVCVADKSNLPGIVGEKGGA